MKIRLLCSALVGGGLIAIAAPSNPGFAQSDDQGSSAAKRAATTVTPHKHRHWRFRGGKHPHYGSRRVGT